MRFWLKELRGQAGYNQQEFAEKVGVSESYICLIEKGIRTPSGVTAYKIAKILKFDMKRFYEDEKIK